MRTGYTWVLGGSGFVGFELSKQLAESKSYSAKLVTVGHKTQNAYLMEQTNHYMRSLFDLDASLLKRFAPEVVFHCARMAGSHSLSRWWAARSGAKANGLLISVLSQLAVKPVVVYCSGTLMYGEQTGLANENSALNPTAYAKPYLEAEMPWIKAREQGLLDVRMARPAWILGPSSWFERFFVRWALTEGYVPVYGHGEQLMSVVSQADCAKQLRHCHSHGRPNNDYNVYGFEPIAQEAFSKLVAQQMGLPVKSVSRLALTKAFGKTVAEALCSNIPVNSIHHEWRQGFKPSYLHLEALIEDTVRQLLTLRNS